MSPISYAAHRLSGRRKNNRRAAVQEGWLIVHAFVGKTGLEVGELERDKNVAVDVALTRFEVRVQNAIRYVMSSQLTTIWDGQHMFFVGRSYGMDITKFNELSESISKQSGLRKRVLLQSYLYK